jgi:hypothetical protein
VALNTVVGFTNKSLRALVSQLLEGPYSTSQMTYDLRRLRLKGLVIRVQHTNSYTLSDDGIRFAVTYTKLGRRVLVDVVVDDPEGVTEFGRRPVGGRPRVAGASEPPNWKSSIPWANSGSQRSRASWVISPRNSKRHGP